MSFVFVVVSGKSFVVENFFVFGKGQREMAKWSRRAICSRRAVVADVFVDTLIQWQNLHNRKKVRTVVGFFKIFIIAQLSDSFRFRK